MTQWINFEYLRKKFVVALKTNSKEGVDETAMSSKDPIRRWWKGGSLMVFLISQRAEI